MWIFFFFFAGQLHKDSTDREIQVGFCKRREGWGARKTTLLADWRAKACEGGVLVAAACR